MKYINYIIGLVVVIVVVFLIAYFVPKVAKSPETGTNNNAVTVTDFESCRTAGFPVQESYPAKCTDSKGQTYTEVIKEGDFVLTSPARGAVIASPLVIQGKAKGNMYFEGTFPAVLKDSNGKVLAQGPIRAQGDWMTTDYVNFSGSLTFATPETELGTLTLKNDNPSGMPENDKIFEVPIRFR